MVESYRDKEVYNEMRGLEISGGRTMVISFPAALRKALVHRTFRGLRFILSTANQVLGAATRSSSGDLLEVFMAPES